MNGVDTHCLDHERGLPLAIEAQGSGNNNNDDNDAAGLVSWVRANADAMERALLAHGALLFRSFDVPDVAGFESAATAMTGGLANYRDIGGGPRERVEGRVYTSTNMPANRRILAHSDGLSMFSWPAKILFYCVTPARAGGETPIADLRRVCERIDPRIRERFIEKGVMYTRNFGGGFALPWQESFQTSSREEVEALCRRGDIQIEWKGGGRLCTRQVLPAVANHPVTGQRVWFNQALNFHLSNLAPATRRALETAFHEEDLPLNVHYGDGSRIPDDDIAAVRQAFEDELVRFPWQRGDILLVDNMLVAHGRETFEGEREIVVGMAAPLTWKDRTKSQVVPERAKRPDDDEERQE